MKTKFSASSSPGHVLPDTVRQFSFVRTYKGSFLHCSWGKLNSVEVRSARNLIVCLIKNKELRDYFENTTKINVSHWLKKKSAEFFFELLNKDYVRKLTIFKIEAAIMSLILEHYSKTKETKCLKSSGEQKNILRQKSHDQNESRVFCIFFTWTPVLPETSFFRYL